MFSYYTALGRSGGDVMIANEAVEAVEAIVRMNDGQFVHAIAAACTPLCLSVMAAPDRFFLFFIFIFIFYFFYVFFECWSVRGGGRCRFVFVRATKVGGRCRGQGGCLARKLSCV